MRCVPIFHDAVKCGWNGSKFTVHDHPILAGQWVRETKVEHDIDDEIKELIARMCERHSGEWTTSKKSTIVLPEPENEMEKLIHMCDLLSSRNNIDMLPPDYLRKIFDDIKSDVEFDEEYIINFGKHKGEKLLDIYKSEPDYIKWCEESLPQRRDLMSMIQAMKEWLKEKENIE